MDAAKFFRTYWSQISFIVIFVFALGAFRADASSSLRQHEERIKSLEAVAPAITADLATIKGQQAIILNSLGQVQGQLMERSK